MGAPDQAKVVPLSDAKGEPAEPQFRGYVGTVAAETAWSATA
jgi:hypothetical protein